MAAKKKIQQEFYGDAPTSIKDHPFYGFVMRALVAVKL